MLVNREHLIHSIERIYPFNLAKPEEIEQLVEKGDVLYFEAGKIIYQEGAAAQFLYLILEGIVEVLKEKYQQLVSLNILDDGNLVGEEALGSYHIRRASARARQDTILLRVERKTLLKIFQVNQKVMEALKILSASHAVLVEGLPFSLSDLESIHYIGRPHRFVFIIKSLSSLIIYILIAGLSVFLFQRGVLSFKVLISTLITFSTLLLLFVLWRFLEWRNDLFIISNQRVVCEDRVALLHDLRLETPMSAIININIRKNIFGRKLGFGDLIIKTYTGSNRLKYVPDVDIVAGLLDYFWKQNKLAARREEREAFRQVMNQQNNNDKEDHLTLINPQVGSTEIFEGFFSSAINRLLRLNVQSKDEITFWTHWIILVKKSFFPGFIFFGVLFLLIFLSINRFPVMGNPFIRGILIGIIVISILWFLYQYLDWRQDQYVITSDQIMDVNRKPFGDEDLRTAPIKNIQSIRYKRAGLLGLLLNYGTVYIRVGDDELTFDHVHNPAAIQEVLFGALQKYLSQQKRSDLSEQQRRMADWIASYLQTGNGKANQPQ